MSNCNCDHLAIIALVVHNRKFNSANLNALISEYSSIIVGRMGIPCNSCDTGLISLIVEVTDDKYEEFVEKLSAISHIEVKILALNC